MHNWYNLEISELKETTLLFQHSKREQYITVLYQHINETIEAGRCVYALLAARTASLVVGGGGGRRLGALLRLARLRGAERSRHAGVALRLALTTLHRTTELCISILIAKRV